MLCAPLVLALSLPLLAQARPGELTGSARAERIQGLTAAALARPLNFAAPPETVLTPRFVFVRDVGLTLPTPPWGDEGAYAVAFSFARQAFAATQPDSKRALVVVTTFDDGGSSLFYLPMANDVRGLGQGTAAAIFDDTPGSVLDGFVWLGSLRALEDAGDAYMSEAFVHELAHRFAAYVRIQHPDAGAEVLLGRQGLHWSFFASLGTSPMEGNDWAPIGDGAWITDLPDSGGLRFSPLDLYLMGLMPAEQVPPFRVLLHPTVIDPPSLEVSASSPPARRTHQPVTMEAVRVAEVRMEHVLAANGPRDPPAGDEPVLWPVGVVLLSSGFEQPSLDTLEQLSERLKGLSADFASATGGRMQLDLSIAGAGRAARGAPCPGGLDTCDRARSDRCVSLIPGSEAVCARSCSDGDDCAAGECCARVGDGTVRACVPAVLCVSSPAPSDAGAGTAEMSVDAGGGLVSAPPAGCRCAGREPGSLLPALLLLLSSSRFLRRCSRAG